MITALVFLGSLVLIIAGAEAFTNAIEWAGSRMHLAHGATGSLLAAIGAALPETTVPVVALISGQPTAEAVATGAVVGAPFLLLTMALAATGLAVMSRRGDPHLVVEARQVRRDLGTFVAAFWILPLGLVLPHWARVVGAVALLLIYANYVRATLRGGEPSEEMPEPLHLLRWSEDPAGRPGLGVILLQVVGSLAMLVGGAELFVHGLNDLAAAIQLPTLLLSLVLVPLATELPETLNSVVWIRARSDGLALGNIAGGVTFQACLLGALGLAFTSWSPGRLGTINLVMTLAIGVYTLILLRHGRCRGWVLLVNAVPWLAYVVLVLVAGNRLQG
ncbi:MAG TPA: sodium:calcium antiporter [Candidatus Dormibacteraeota bacterium]|jgi:cation:H+ antiporter|nr:sodium:calcium antiporter [Candidatus Dormibacteraeota bacterium]